MKRWLWLVAFVLLVAPCVARAADLTPNDPFFSKQWYLKKIGMERAWGLMSQAVSTTVPIVAVIDTRVDIEHRDLKDAIWTNDGEIPGNGIDDDRNGYVDDIHGWNFIDGSGDVVAKMASGTTLEAYVHGTAVSSLIAARGNNGEGMAGISWHARIMPIVGLDEMGRGMTDRVADAVNYAVRNGASIINMSIEGDARDPVLDEAIANAKKHSVLTVVAAGNSSEPGGRDLDTNPVYPTCSSRDAMVNLIAVGSTGENDRRSEFSDYGSCVSLSAPGEDIFGAEPESTYSDGWYGTSLAAPMVSGAAALLKELHPRWTPDQIKDHLMKTSDAIDDLQFDFQGKLGAGRLNVAAALEGGLERDSFEIKATNPGVQTEVFIETQSVSPFGISDARGARVAIGDMDKNGIPEIAVVPSSGTSTDFVLLKSNGDEIDRLVLPGSFKDGGVITAVDGGYVVADADGGAAWGIDAQLTVHPFFPYEKHYQNGVDLMTIQHQAAFAPRDGGGRLVISDVKGSQIVSAFPFGIGPEGRWSLARMDAVDGSFIVFSGPSGSKRIGVEAIGQVGWNDVSFGELSLSKITLSSGMRTDNVNIQSYGSWNE